MEHETFKMTNSFLYSFSQALNQDKAPPALYVVATPIGNLEDITLRALRILSAVTQIACEDTRVSQKLLNHYEIKKKLIAYNDFSHAKVKESIIAMIEQGESVALISDAGTPLISDPGYKLVSDCIAHGIQVVPIPGASALTASLSACGVSTDQFFFYGFMPRKEGEIKNAFEQMRQMNSTIVCYESAKRVLKTLLKMQSYFGVEFEVCIAREITKKFEIFKKDQLQHLIGFFEDHPPKGEIVMIFNTKTEQAAMSDTEILKLIAQYPADMPTKKLAAELTEVAHLPKRELYHLILKAREDSDDQS